MKTPPTPNESDSQAAYHRAVLLLDIARQAQHDHENGVTFADGLAALRAGGALDFELNEYAMARQLAMLSKIAAGSGIEIVLWNVGGKETSH